MWLLTSLRPLVSFRTKSTIVVHPCTRTATEWINIKHVFPLPQYWKYFLGAFLNKCNMKMLKNLAQVLPKISVTMGFIFTSEISTWPMAWTTPIPVLLEELNCVVQKFLHHGRNSMKLFEYVSSVTPRIKFVGSVRQLVMSLSSDVCFKRRLHSEWEELGAGFPCKLLWASCTSLNLRNKGKWMGKGYAGTATTWEAIAELFLDCWYYWRHSNKI